MGVMHTGARVPVMNEIVQRFVHAYQGQVIHARDESTRGYETMNARAYAQDIHDAATIILTDDEFERFENTRQKIERGDYV
jgi:hypothetical protein